MHLWTFLKKFFSKSRWNVLELRRNVRAPPPPPAPSTLKCPPQQLQSVFPLRDYNSVTFEFYAKPITFSCLARRNESIGVSFHDFEKKILKVHICI
jgi:hypothetical protein